MRRGIKNYVSVRVVGMDLTECTDLKFYVEQDGAVHEYTGTVELDDVEVMKVIIPKADAIKFDKGYAQVQVALTDSTGVPRSHDPIRIMMGDFLEVMGYGN